MAVAYGLWRTAVVRALVVGLALASGGVAPVSAGVAQAPGCPVLPADNVWNADVSALPVHPRSADWINSMGGPARHLHPDYGPSGGSVPYGIPYIVVPGSHAKVGVSFQYADESDRGPYPFDGSTPIEGGQNAGGDRHALMLDKDACVLYELFDANWNSGQPTAGSGAVFDLRSDGLRPSGWTSADAAGLPIFPGLVRLDEVNAGAINHAIRVTAQQTDRRFIWPARHQAGSAADPTLPPMGARFRMKAGVDISGYLPATRVILTAFKRYGLIVADNGSNWFFSGAAEDGWDNNVLDQLKSIPAGDFEAVDESGLMADPNSGRVRTANPPPPPPTHAPPPSPPASVAIPVASPPPSTAASPSPSLVVAEGVTASPPATTYDDGGNPPPATGGPPIELLVLGLVVILGGGVVALAYRRGQA